MAITRNIIKELALQAGADQVGITGAKPLLYMKERLDKRLKEKRVTSFEESDPASRLDPGRRLKKARSIITMAVPYAPPDHPDPVKGAEPAGKVARCARGLDYHGLVEELGRKVVEKLRQEIKPAFNYLILCDRSPLLERELARNSGLGVIGENCTLINPTYGSYTALGTILVDMEIEPDQAETGSCQKCGKCREACPTGALEAPYVINPNICLSYLTQVSGIFPRELRPRLGRQVYGCDICQESCPHNKGVPGSPFPEMAFSYFPAEPLLMPLLRITQKEYKSTIGLTSAGWRGKTTLQRNAVIALGNIKDPSSVRSLSALLANDPRPVIRAHAAWALGRIRTGKALFALEKSNQNDPEAGVRAEAMAALAES